MRVSLQQHKRYKDLPSVIHTILKGGSLVIIRHMTFAVVAYCDCMKNVAKKRVGTPTGFSRAW